ncbi:MAG TPA: transposase, partial [Nitrosopumilaceae archaeon]|nr:transposase [Nitrosopumilaceae archaeon]
MLKSTNICYSLLLIASIERRSFTTLGQVIQKSGDTVRRLLNPVPKIYGLLDNIAIKLFKNTKEVVCSIDDTLLKKAFSRFIEGTDKFFDTLIGRKIMSYKLLTGSITNGQYTIPLRFEFVPSKDMLATAAEFKEELVKKMILEVLKIFPDKTIIVAADGAFATKKLLKWVLDNGIKMEVRMHANRVIEYNGEKVQIRQITNLLPKGRHMARTIKAVWHDLALNITAERRIDKHGEESIVYQAATYDAPPSKHVANYKKRWPSEKLYRTSKQHLG